MKEKEEEMKKCECEYCHKKMACEEEKIDHTHWCNKCFEKDLRRAKRYNHTDRSVSEKGFDPDNCDHGEGHCIGNLGRACNQPKCNHIIIHCPKCGEKLTGE